MVKNHGMKITVKRKNISNPMFHWYFLSYQMMRLAFPKERVSRLRCLCYLEYQNIQDNLWTENLWSFPLPPPPEEPPDKNHAAEIYIKYLFHWYLLFLRSDK